MQTLVYSSTMVHLFPERRRPNGSVGMGVQSRVLVLTHQNIMMVCRQGAKSVLGERI